MPGEPECPQQYIGIDCTLLGLIDKDGVASRLIMNSAGPFGLYVNFYLCGSFALPLTCLKLPFEVIYYVDQHGGPIDKVLATKSGQLTPGKLNYGQAETEVNIPVGSLPPGTFELTAVVKFPIDCQWPLPLSGFNMVDCIQVM